MLLEGARHCKAVHFSVESREPYPCQACYLRVTVAFQTNTRLQPSPSICCKMAGGGRYATNLGADANKLEAEGAENFTVYNARLYEQGEPSEVSASEAERNVGSGRA